MFVLIESPCYVVSHFFHCNNVTLFDKDMLPFCNRVMLNHVSNKVLVLNKSL